jgi:hypothetical protein
LQGRSMIKRFLRVFQRTGWASRIVG